MIALTAEIAPRRNFPQRVIMNRLIFRRFFSRISRTRYLRNSAALVRWAEGLYRESPVASAPRGMILSLDQLAEHAAALAGAHGPAQPGGSDHLLHRLRDSRRVIAKCHDMVSRAYDASRRLSPAAEWLLDNHYLIEEQIFLVRKYCPHGFSRYLPRLTGPGTHDLRVYDLIREYVRRVDGRVDDASLQHYLHTYQTVTPLTIGELWSVSIMTRLALIENIRGVAEGMSWRRAHRDRALAWAEQMAAPADSPEAALRVLADLVQSEPVLSPAFVAQLSHSLQRQGSTGAYALAWVEQQLGDLGQSIDELVRSENQSQAGDTASMANSIASLRQVDASQWEALVESLSAMDAILRTDPAGVYGLMDFRTRDSYRHVVEALARRLDLSEEEVARTAIHLTREQYELDPDTVQAHVGFVLIDSGRPHLERALRRRRAAALVAQPTVRRIQLALYLIPIASIAFVGLQSLTAQLLLLPVVLAVLLGAAAVLAASQTAIVSINWLATLLRLPRTLPRMDFEKSIPTSSRTLVAVPTLLTDAASAKRLINGLEKRYLANRDPNLWFALLTDFADADRESTASDDPLLQIMVTGIALLNERYAGPEPGRFLLLHRPRLFNAREGLWMGRERKRGKLEDLNQLILTGDTSRFMNVTGGFEDLQTVRYVITLDTDTDLPWGAGCRLVASAAHPLNRPHLNGTGRRLTRGYVILQPRVSISPRSARQSWYSRSMAGEVGLDPYTRLVSNVYHDLFAEASFIGKGIYDVATFHQILEGRFPDNRVLSHDLLESCYARAGQCSDVELLEDTPASYLADVSRRHRWMRGDWQIVAWLGFSVSDSHGHRTMPLLAGLGWWKIFDNVRRALLSPAYMGLFVVGWLVLPNAGAWTISVMALPLAPELLPFIADITNRPRRLPIRYHLGAVTHNLLRRASNLVLWVAFLPFEAAVAMDAALRSWWRLSITGRHLLEWQTAASVEAASTVTQRGTFVRMWPGPALAATLVIWFSLRGVADSTLLPIAPLLVLWLLSPWLAWKISRPRPSGHAPLKGSDADIVRTLARLTWRYFEVFAGAQENWLPPDNVQQGGHPRVAHRTSPTNMGMALLANLTALDLGYVTKRQFLERTGHAIDSMETLERHRGHFFNWYDTVTRKPLTPLYVSTVDSGNLAGHARVLHAGLLEIHLAPLIPASLQTGLEDTFRALVEHIGSNVACDRIADRLRQVPQGLFAYAAWLTDLGERVAEQALSVSPVRTPEGAWWAHALERQVHAHQVELLTLAPWLERNFVRDPSDRAIYALLDAAESCSDMSLRCHDALLRLNSEPDRQSGGQLEQAMNVALLACKSRQQMCVNLSLRAMDLATAEFGFLYNERRKLLSIGFWTQECRLDVSHYDLLASESRLASYLAIASGQIPFDHWFMLGRRLTGRPNRAVLVSWSGSMFEYLMPSLVMPSLEETLIDATCQEAVAKQIAYGQQRNVPWGVSESCYNTTDVEGTYQYRAFGVPGLGLSRGLEDHLVIAPYATALALLVAPIEACSNLRRMVELGWCGAYGMVEAVDYSTGRDENDEQPTQIPTFMAHHHGMSLVAMASALQGQRMQERFLSHPDLFATSLLLEERIPRPTAILRLSEEPVEQNAARKRSRTAPAMRVIRTPNGPATEIQFLSNGRYHVMVTAGGGGYSRWNDLSITRWREDATLDCPAAWFHLLDVDSGHGWTNTFIPSLKAGGNHEAIFTAGRAEFRRHDDRLETHTTIAVSATDNVEVRRLRLTNRTRAARSMSVTTYLEPVLARMGTDEAHRTFSNLFVTTEAAADQRSVLVGRRKRDPTDAEMWGFVLLLGADNEACSVETDREKFIGRLHSVRDPVALTHARPLSGTTGNPLDPCVAFRQRLIVPADSAAQLDLVIGVAASREEALALIARYRDPRMADRVFEVAAPHFRAVINQLGASEGECEQYSRLAAAVLTPHLAWRAPTQMLRNNRRGQSSLWAYGISGDLPMVLLRVSDANHLHLLKEVVQAHAFWRAHGVTVDVVIWNEDPGSYRDVLNDHILAVVAAGPEGAEPDRPGGFFVRHVDAFSESDRVLLQACARVVLRDLDGTLDEQLERRRRAMLPTRALSLATSRGRNSVGSARPFPGPAEPLCSATEYGGFVSEGDAFVIHTTTTRPTPAPWVNVLANDLLGTVISETGSAYTWFGNAQRYRLTPWMNDAVSDACGEYLYVRDEVTGKAFAPGFPLQDSLGRTRCTHAHGYSRHERDDEDLSTVLTTWVDASAPIRFQSLRIHNTGTSTRHLSVWCAVDLVLGETRARHAMHTVTEVEPRTGALMARNSYHAEYPEVVTFLDCTEAVRTVSGDRSEFLGRNGDPSQPAGLRLRQLSGRLGAGLDPCFAMHIPMRIEPEQEMEIVFMLGATNSRAEAISLLQSYDGVPAARVSLTRTRSIWAERTETIRVETPDNELNILLSGWLPYQILSSRIMGRSGFYQSGGAYGFRDQLQDHMALVHEQPGRVREHLLRCAGRQFAEGDVQHWWHPRDGQGVRTRCSDDYLWLPWAVAHYVRATGDISVLDAQVTWLTGRLPEDGEESAYSRPGVTESTSTLYEHCQRAITHGFRTGTHGLPLMGSGDWNDGMSQVGIHGRGESVWLAMFLHQVLSDFSVLALKRDDHLFLEQCTHEAAELSEALREHAWDGQWYQRAWMDDGTPLGSSTNTECRIDSLPQSWATIAHIGSIERRNSALDSLWEQLVVPGHQVVLLFTPPFDKGTIEPGYIKGYPPGVRENGGQYTHAAVWAAIAFALAGRSAQSSTLLRMLNPVAHARTAEDIFRYRVEPYVVAADVYGVAPWAGRGGWTWYTAAAAWLYRFTTETYLGLERQGNTLCFRPRVQEDWMRYIVHYRFGLTRYRITFTRINGIGNEIAVTVDHILQPTHCLLLTDDGATHEVDVQFDTFVPAPELLP